MGTATDVRAGTVETHRQRAGESDFSEVVFAPGYRLPWHFHPRSCLAVVIGGAVRKRFARVEEEAGDGTVVQMPAEERHEDLFGREGARLIVLESETEPGTRRSFRDWRATVLAHSVSRELAAPDAYSPLALEGLALELRALASRQPAPGRHDHRLETVRDMLAADLASPPSLSQIASEVGLHPSHLARLFRARHGVSIGEYGRRLRLDWAAHRLVVSDEALAVIAARAGFADQSHITREFKRRYGVSPGRYRIAHR